MKNFSVAISLSLALAATCNAQQSMSIDDCMRYAILHNHDVRQQQLSLDNNKAARVEAIGSFLPAIALGVDAQYNFGRAVDPETNIYTNVNTFSNYNQLNISLPLFDGLRSVHLLQAEKANVLMGENALKAEKDRVAILVFQAYIDALYYSGTSAMANAKLAESTTMLRQTRLMEEVGQKSAADVALMEAQLAGDEYEVIRQRNLLLSAMLSLKTAMNFSGDLSLDSLSALSAGLPDMVPDAVGANCQVEAAYNQMEAARRSYQSSKAVFMPSLYVNAGIGSSYNKVLGQEAASFADQMRNKQGKYLAASLNIPIFNRLSSVASVRKAKNNYKISRELYEAKQQELDALRTQAYIDAEGYAKLVAQMHKKVASDSIAYTLTCRKYTEGLASPVEVQQSAANLLQSRASLLQSQLMAAIKTKLCRYYNGEPMVEY